MIEIQVGQKYGHLTVLRYLGVRNMRHWWLCGCVCGWYKEEDRRNFLKPIPVSSCGHCRPNQRFKSEHESWESMKARCYVENRKDYHRYGGRGIIVCPEWRYNFWQFLLDMGFRPSLEHTLDRIDTNGNYEKDNCKWSTILEQNNNRNPRNTFKINI